MTVSIKTITDTIGLYQYPQLQLVTVGNWKVVCKKNNFKIGDKVIYVSIDSYLSGVTKYATIFKSYLCILSNGDKGYWIRPIKLAGIVSSGVILPASMLDIIKEVKNYNSNPYSYVQDIEVNFKVKYNISKYYSAKKTVLVEDNINIDISFNRLLVDGMKYADCYNIEDSKCKGLLFSSNNCNFIIPSMTYFFYEYPTNPDTNPELSGDYEPVDYDDYDDSVTDDDVTNLDNKDIETTDYHIDTD